MFAFRLSIQYFAWHYTQAIVDLWRILENITWFIVQFFSMGTVARTLFAPWRRMDEAPRGGFHPQEWFEALVVNILMRIVGFFMRLILLLLGLTALIVVIVTGIAVMVVWFFMPLVILFAFIAGGMLLSSTFMS